MWMGILLTSVASFLTLSSKRWPIGLEAQSFVVVQLLSHVWLFATPWTAAHQASLSSTISWNLLKLMSFESVTPSNHLILSNPPLLPSVFSSIRVFLRSRLFTLGGLSIIASASASVLPKNIQDWFPLGLTGLISLLSKRLSRVFPAPQFESINSLVLSLLTVQLSYD